MDTLQQEVTPEMKKATEFVGANNTSDIIEQLALLYKRIKELEDNSFQKDVRLNQFKDTVKDFIVEHIEEPSNIDKDDLKDLAGSLYIELTRSVQVTFKIEVTSDIEVPIDYDIQDIDSSDYDIDVRWTGTSDISETNTDFNVEDLEAEEQ